MHGADHAEAANRLREPIGSLVQRLTGDWAPLVRAWHASAAGQALARFVDARVAGGAVVYPADVFRALDLTPLGRTRVVILGQDPYHGPGQAEGVAFSVPAGVRHPPSLRNILAELGRDVRTPVPESGSLLAWATQGVLLLNTALTVEQGRPGSHSGKGWEALTDGIVNAAARDPQPKVFMLWGAHAQARASLVTAEGASHLLLQCNHPSPLSARRPPVPFAGCGHFGRAESFLGADAPPDWRLDGVRSAEIVPNGDIVYGSPRRGARVAKGGRL